MSEDPTAMHGIFLLNHVVPQLVVAAFTQSFYFGAFLQLIVNVMIFNVLLPPRPLPFDFLVELNVIFVAAQMGGTVVGTALAQALGMPPILEVTLPWEVRQQRRDGWYAWGLATWARAAFTVVLLTAVTGGHLRLRRERVDAGKLCVVGPREQRHSRRCVRNCLRNPVVRRRRRPMAAATPPVCKP